MSEEYWNAEEINETFEQQIKEEAIAKYNSENTEHFGKWYSDIQYCLPTHAENRHIVLNGQLFKLSNEYSNAELLFRYPIMAFGEFQGISDMRRLYINDADPNATDELGAYITEDKWRNWGNGDFIVVSIVKKT